MNVTRKQRILEILKNIKINKKLTPVIVILASIMLFKIIVYTKANPDKKDYINKIEEAVDVIFAKKTNANISIQAHSLIEPKNQTDLISEVSGKIIEISDKFNEGFINKEKQKLIKIEDTYYKTELIKSQSKLANAQASLKLEKARSEVAKEDWRKVKSRKPSELGLRIPQLKKFEMEVKYAQSMIKLAKQNIKRTLITTPYRSLVIKRNASLGQYVTKGYKLGKLVDINIAKIKIPLNTEQAYLLDISEKKDLTVEVRKTKSKSQYIWKTKLINKEMIVNEKNRMIYVFAEIRNPYSFNKEKKVEPLRFGSFVKVSIKGIRVKNVFKIPRSSIAQEYNKEFIYIIDKDNMARKKYIKTITKKNNYAYIKEGIKEGDIIAKLARKIKPNIKVKINDSSHKKDSSA